MAKFTHIELDCLCCGASFNAPAERWWDEDDSGVELVQDENPCPECGEVWTPGESEDKNYERKQMGLVN